ncbi:MAG: 1-acyl-sn-glycerol-3-phosphate acyltransferase [Planctomyces sp.]|nr:1-acyl-sn-glycerol-3-phosphate acyltransferase [Planctomyces sp.]
MEETPGRARGRRRNAIWRVCQIMLQNVMTLGLQYRARGQERLPDGPALLLINHQSFLDPLLAALPLPRPVSYLARDNLFRVPVIGWILRQTYVMPIRRNAAGTEALRESLRRLEAGYYVGVFPEGTRTRDGSLGPLKPGFLALARRAACPVIPVAIAGAFEAFPRGAVLPRPRRVRVVYGEPIPPAEIAGLSNREDEQAFLRLVAQRMGACLAEAEAWRRTS